MNKSLDRNLSPAEPIANRPIQIRPGWVGLGLAIVVAALYLPTLSHPFVFDDVPELVRSPDVLSFGGCLDTIGRSQNTGLSGRLVACLSFAANVQAGGFSVRGFHLVNILIHLLAACTLYGVVRRTMDRTMPAGKKSSAARREPRPPEYISTIWACVIALLWAVHPLQTESVTYVIQRIESLAGLWYLLTLYCAIRSWSSARYLLWGGLSVLCCALGMLTKETVVTAPLVVLLYDRVFLHGAMSNVLRRKTRLHLALAATWVIPILLNLNSPRGTSAGFGLGVSVLDNLRTQAGVILHYLKLTLWPFPQAISYFDWPIVRNWAPALLPGLTIVGLLLLSVAGLLRRRWWGFCGAWFFLILAPSSSFIPIVTEPAAERRMYLPLAAVIIVLIFAIRFALQRLLPSSQSRRLASRILAVAFIAYFSGATLARNAQYATVEGILTSTLHVRPGDDLVRGALLEELVHQGRIQDARRVLDEGLARNPQAFLLHDNWARAMSDAGRHEEAVESYRKALAIRPDYQPSLSGIGIALMAIGKFAEALPYLQRALEVAPRAYIVRGNLAVALASLGRTEEAITELRTALQLKPAYAEGHYNLGRLLFEQAKKEEAVVHLRRAVALRPGDLEFQQELDAALSPDHAPKRQP